MYIWREVSHAFNVFFSPTPSSALEFLLIKQNHGVNSLISHEMVRYLSYSPLEALVFTSK